MRSNVGVLAWVTFSDRLAIWVPAIRQSLMKWSGDCWSTLRTTGRAILTDFRGFRFTIGTRRPEQRSCAVTWVPAPG